VRGGDTRDERKWVFQTFSVVVARSCLSLTLIYHLIFLKSIPTHLHLQDIFPFFFFSFSVSFSLLTPQSLFPSKLEGALYLYYKYKYQLVVISNKLLISEAKKKGKKKGERRVCSCSCSCSCSIVPLFFCLLAQQQKQRCSEMM
jgi:hypothetical protein